METTFKDYYAALDLEPNASDQEIKQAYRKLARKYHPDVNPGDQAAEERFKEVNEAYQALSDPQKRRKYDDLRQHYEQGGSGFNWGGWQTHPGAGGGPGAQYYSQTVSPEDLQDLFGEQSPFSDFFRSMFGGQAAPGAGVGGFGGSVGGGSRRGRDSEATVELTLEEALRGTTRAIQVGGRRIEARIPAGVRTGSRVRLAEQGHPGLNEGQPGDLFLLVEVLPHPRFERDGDDLRCTFPLDIYTAATGGEVRVQTLDGSVLLKIPPRTQAERTFRLRGKGMPRLNQPDSRGDMFARAQLVLPEPLSDHEVETLRELAQARQRS
jgi:curved DNA-binding protein